jgi:hypothetical protein
VPALEGALSAKNYKPVLIPPANRLKLRISGSGVRILPVRHLLVYAGARRAFAEHYWSASAPRTNISATNLGPMSWAIHRAAGVQCARSERRVAETD